MRKTLEQLQAQLESVNIGRREKYQEPLKAPEGNFDVFSKEDRGRILEQLGGDPENHQKKEDYQRYVSLLREIRQDERSKLESVLEDVQENRADAFVEAATSGTVRVRRLQSLQPEDTSGRSKRVLTDEQVEAARGSEEKFQETLHSALQRKPELIIDVLRYFPDVVNKEEARQLFEKAAEERNFSLLWYFEAVEPLYTPDENKGLLAQLFIKNPDTTLSVLNRPAIAKHFSPDERKKFLLNTLGKKTHSGPDVEKIIPYVQDGTISETDLQQIVLDAIGNSQTYRTPEHLKLCTEYFRDDAARTTLAQALMAAYTRTENPLDVSGATDFIQQGILPVEKVRDTIRQRIGEKTSAIFNLRSLATQYLPETEVRSAVRAAIQEKPEDFFRNYFASEQFRQYFTLEELQSLCQHVADNNPRYLIYDSHFVISVFPDVENRKKIFEKLLQETGIEQFILQADNLFEGLGIIDDKEKKRIWEEKLLEGPVFDYVEKFLSPGSTLNKLFTTEEILTIFHRQLELGVGDLFQNVDKVRKLVGGDEALKQVVQKALNRDPATVAYGIDQIIYLFSSQEIREHVTRLSQDARGGQIVMLGIEKWAPATGDDFSWEIIQRQVSSQAAVMILELDKLWPYIPEEKRKSFVREIILSQPLVALESIKEFELKSPELTKETILSMAGEDKERWSLAPKQLKELFDRYAAETDVSQRQLIAKQGMDLYTTLNCVKESGLESHYQRVLSQEALGAKREHQLLLGFYCLSLLAREDPALAERVGKINNADEVQKVVFAELCRSMKLEDTIDDASVNNFFAAMESPVPFTVYLLQYRNSPEHFKLLQEMFGACLRGEYANWKFGDLTDESLRELKEKEYLPQGLTLDQYKGWSEDGSTTLFETLAMDSHEAARAVNRDIEDNRMHLQNSRLEEASLSISTLGEISRELGAMGQQLAATNKEVGELKKQPDAEASRLGVLQMKKTYLESERRTLLAARGIIRLALLKPEELVAGCLLEGKDGKTKGDPLPRLINDLRREIGTEGQFVLDNIEKKLAVFSSQTEAKENLECTDSSRIDDLLLVGAVPVGSCQHYAYGSHNDCLLGYSGPETKIVMLRNERSNVVARAIVRLLSNKEGLPTIHLERIYSSSLSKGVTKVMYQHLLGKAGRLNMPLYTSERAQNEHGQPVDMVMEGASFEKSPSKLYSHRNRAPKVYVDSADGARSFGKYSLSSIMEIKSA